MYKSKVRSKNRKEEVEESIILGALTVNNEDLAV
jgi:hypothetical protein